MRFAYLGNHEPAHSTENEVRAAAEAEGHTVTAIQEGTPAGDVPGLAAGADVFLWTQTQSLAERAGTVDDRARMLATIGADMPTVACHLDRWWGLARQPLIFTEPFFRCALVFTADGHHTRQWEQVGVNHVWWPPATGHRNLQPAHPDEGRFGAGVAFVGSWTGGYHPEWSHRPELVSHLRHVWDARMFPDRGRPAVRGDDLRTLYATVKVSVGDSCLVPGVDGQPMTRYISDRIPETLGRGGLLIHPHVDGVTDGTLYTDGEHLACWKLGDWDQLDGLIGHYLDHPDEARQVATEGRRHVAAHHTYRNRVRSITAQLRARGWV